MIGRATARRRALDRPARTPRRSCCPTEPVPAPARRDADPSAPAGRQHRGSGRGRRAPAVPTRKTVVEALAVRGEREDHRPRRSPRRSTVPRSQMRRTSMRSSRVSLRPITTQWSVCGTPPSTSAWRTCQPIVVATESASSGGSVPRWRPDVASRCSRPSSDEHLGVPVGMGPDETGQSAHPVGEPTDLGVDEPGGQPVPRLVAGQRWVGQPGAQAIVEPAVELGEAGGHAGDAVVARLAWFGWREDRATAGALSRGSGCVSSRRGCRCGARERSPRRAVRLAIHDVANGGGSTLGDLAARPQQQQRQRVLAGNDAAGAGAAEGHLDVVDRAFVGLGTAADAPAPHRPRVAPRAGPARRNGQRLGGGDRRRSRRQRQHLLDLPTTTAHPCHRSKGVRHGTLRQSGDDVGPSPVRPRHELPGRDRRAAVLPRQAARRASGSRWWLGSPG